MANQTTLASACGLNDAYITVTSATGALTGNVIIVDGEQMRQSGDAVGTQIPVIRGGKGGTVQSSHAILAPVLMGTATEIAGTQPASSGTVLQPYKRVITSYGASGAIAPPNIDTLIFLTKATAAAMTLADPVAGTPDGVEVTIMSNTDAAHTVTNTTGFYGNGTTSDVATFAATQGASMTIIARQGKWGVKSLAAVTIA